MIPSCAKKWASAGVALSSPPELCTNGCRKYADPPGARSSGSCCRRCSSMAAVLGCACLVNAVGVARACTAVGAINCSRMFQTELFSSGLSFGSSGAFDSEWSQPIEMPLGSGVGANACRTGAGARGTVFALVSNALSQGGLALGVGARVFPRVVAKFASGIRSTSGLNNLTGAGNGVGEFVLGSSRDSRTLARSNCGSSRSVLTLPCCACCCRTCFRCTTCCRCSVEVLAFFLRDDRFCCSAALLLR